MHSLELNGCGVLGILMNDWEERGGALIVQPGL